MLMVKVFRHHRNARGFAFADRGEDRGAGHPAVVAACRAPARPLAQRGLVASLLFGAALLMGSDGALAAACTFPLSLAQGATCDGLTVNAGETGDLNNQGVITSTGENSAVRNDGTISHFNNAGRLAPATWYGIYNSSTGRIDALTNSGEISVTDGQREGIYNAGQISNLTNTNSGMIIGFQGIYNSATGTITALTNYGEISGSLTKRNVQAIKNYGTIGSLTNRGTITSGNKGIANEKTITLLDNFGSILSEDSAVQNNDSLSTLINEQSGKMIGSYGFFNNGTVEILTNYGRIEGTEGEGIQQDNQQGRDVSTRIIKIIKNYGVITGSSDGIFNIYNLGDVYNYSNASISGGDTGLYSWGNFSTIARIANIINDGSISGESSYGIYNDGPNVSITAITNKGSITGGLFGIYNDRGSIGTLTNGQGGNGKSAETKALTYKGALPSSYFIYVSDKTHYGQTVFTDPTGKMTFGVGAGSNLANGTYKSVITGLTSSFVNAASG